MNPDAGDHRLRRDPLSGAWVVLAPGRRARPGAPTGGAGAVSPPPCPFCPGNEALTPPEVDALRPPHTRPDGPGWTVRVVPNKYPAFPRSHEVIVHSPDHGRDMEDLDEAAAEAVLDMYARRLDAHLGAGARAVTIICNRGSRAGSSLEHPHSQLYALPIVPPLLLEELENLTRYRNRYGECLLCAALDDARAAPASLLFDDLLVAWVPAAARWPFEVRLAPAHHEEDFRAADTGATAVAMRRVIGALRRAAGDAPINYWLHTAPADLRGPFHWHFEFAPRFAAPAAFELGTGMTIDELEPEEAAARLRAALD